MRVLAFLLISVVVTLNVIVVEAAKGKSTVAVPRKAKGNPISRSVFGSMFTRAFREMKVTFCSELEALTLQLTRPTDTQVSLKNLDDLVRCLNAEYDNPQFTVSLLAKFSRKLCEPNVFTKLKSLICLHKMMQECDSNAQNALTQSVRSLKSEKDEKVGVSFFSSESIEQAAGSASNVAELEAVELAREYATYVLNFVDFRGEKISKNNSKGKHKKETDVEERAELLLELVELSESVQKCCKQSQNGQVVMQCLTCVMDDRPWLTKQMQKVYEAGLEDLELEAELEQALHKWDPKFKANKKAAGAIGSTGGAKAVVKSLSEREEEMEIKEKKVVKDLKDVMKEATLKEVKEKEMKEEKKAATPAPVVAKAVVAPVIVTEVAAAATAAAATALPVVGAAVTPAVEIVAPEKKVTVEKPSVSSKVTPTTPPSTSTSSSTTTRKSTSQPDSSVKSSTKTSPKAGILKKNVSKSPVSSAKKSVAVPEKKSKKSVPSPKSSSSSSKKSSKGGKSTESSRSVGSKSSKKK